MRVSFAIVTLSIAAALACGQRASKLEPKRPLFRLLSPATSRTSMFASAIPREDIEVAMGRKLFGAPQHFEYYDAPGTSGCWYDAGKDASKEAHFGYVVFTSREVYNCQPLCKNVAVNGIGVSAYFDNGADARQLWVNVADKVAFVVAFGDVPKEEGAKAIADSSLQRSSCVVASFTFSFTYSPRFEENNSKPGNRETSGNARKVDRCAEAKTSRHGEAQFS